MLKSIFYKLYSSNHHTKSSNYTYLLIALLGILFSPIVLSIIPIYPKLISTLMFNGLLLVGLYICTTSPKDLLIGFSLGFLAWLFLWLNYAFQEHTLFILFSHIALLAFFCYLVFHLFQSLKEYRRLSNNIIYAAICGFLMIGISGAQSIQIVEVLVPNSFLNLKDSFYNPIYFSFVSVTTIGFGDIVPLTNSAKALSIFLGIAGQMYVTLIVGIMVGKYLKQ